MSEPFIRPHAEIFDLSDVRIGFCTGTFSLNQSRDNPRIFEMHMSRVLFITNVVADGSEKFVVEASGRRWIVDIDGMSEGVSTDGKSLAYESVSMIATLMEDPLSWIYEPV